MVAQVIKTKMFPKSLEVNWEWYLEALKQEATRLQEAGRDRVTIESLRAGAETIHMRLRVLENDLQERQRIIEEFESEEKQKSVFIPAHTRDAAEWEGPVKNPIPNEITCAADGGPTIKTNG